MKCENCQEELNEGAAFCANCGQPTVQEEQIEQETAVVADQVAEETTPVEEQLAVEEAPVQPETENVQEEKSGGNWWKILLIALAGATLGVALTFLVLLGSGMLTRQPEETQPQQTEPTVTITDSYYADDETVKEKANEIVATSGTNVLTNGRFQIYYWTNLLTFLQNYGTYYFDLSQPLAGQYLSENVSWEAYFVDGAINNWHCYAVLCQQAQSEGFVLSTEQQEYLETLDVYMESIALDNGYENAQALVEVEFGAGATVEDYIAYMYEYTYATEYYAMKYEDFQPTQEEIETYFAENEESYFNSGLTRDTKVVDVRHILVKFKSETGATEYTEEELQAANDQAQVILNQWLAGDANEESFAALAEEYSEDPGSKDNGGLYEDVTSGYMVEPFDAWIFDASRQIGDYGIVKTDYGYHVMFFSGSELQWPSVAEQDLIAQMAQQMLSDAMDNWPSETQYDNLVIGNVDLAA